MIPPKAREAPKLGMFGIVKGPVALARSQVWSVVPAVGGVVVDRAIAKLESWDSLGDGVMDWALSEAVESASLAFRGFRVFLETHRLPYLHEHPEGLLRYWRCLWLSGDFIPLAKWVTAVHLAEMAGVTSDDGTEVLFRELPPMPAWLPCGTKALSALFPLHTSKNIHNTLRTRLREKKSGPKGGPTLRAVKLAWSLLGVKAMMPPMRADAVADTLKDHAGLLSAAPPPLPAKAEAILTLLGNSIARLCYGAGTTLRELPRARLSASSGYVKEFDDESKRWRTSEGTRAAQNAKNGGRAMRELTSMIYSPHKGVVEIHQVAYCFDIHDWDYDPCVDVVALQEPFKIRTITIADGPSMAVGSSLQKAWHNAMRELRCFQLIGGKDVGECVKEMFEFGNSFVSGDYSAATDRVSILATKVVFNALVKPLALDPVARARLESGLYGAEVSYGNTLSSLRRTLPEGMYKKLVEDLPDSFQQKNGQLMGNILSFPILCIINLATWLLAHQGLDTAARRETSGRSPIAQTLHDALDRGYLTPREMNGFKVLVNGDDILFQSNQALYTSWRDTIPHLGFKLSVGKNYISNDFFTINSELYTAGDDGVPCKRERPWWGGFCPDFYQLQKAAQKIGFKNPVGERMELSNDMRRVLPKVQDRLRMSLPKESWAIANKQWFATMKDAGLLDPYKGLAWHLPVEFGGMGLDDTGLKESVVTYAQRKLAVKMVLDPEHCPKGFSPDGSLVTAEMTKKYRDTFPYQTLETEPVIAGRHTYALSERPLRVTFCFFDSAPIVGPIESPGYYAPHEARPPLARLPLGGIPQQAFCRIEYVLHETIESKVQTSSTIDKWLDYHQDGVRISPQEVELRVSKWLKWGCEISDKTVDRLYEGLRERYHVRALQAKVYMTPSEVAALRTVS